MKALFTQPFTYQVNAGASYTVSGTATGLLTSGYAGSNGNCTAYAANDPAHPRDWRLVGRIPIRGTNPDGAPAASLCPSLNNDDNNSVLPVDSSPDAGTPMYANQIAQERLNRSLALPANAEVFNRLNSANALPAGPLPDPTVDHSDLQNPCLFVGGPVASDTGSATHVRALFENDEISFVLANIEREPPSGLQISFDVNGGSRPQSVIYPSTVSVSAAARIVLGPIDSQIATASPAPTFTAPFLYVVDQRRVTQTQAGGPTRGQLLRINPIGYAATIGNATGVMPEYDDLTTSINLFPIQ